MTGELLPKPVKEPSPLTKAQAKNLMEQWAQVDDSPNNSLGQWDIVLHAQKRNYEEVRNAILWVKANRPGLYLVSFLKDIDWYIEQAKRDPVLAQIPCSRVAIAVAESLYEQGCGIEPEYVQQAITNYSAFLQVLTHIIDAKDDDSETYRSIWYRLPDTGNFVKVWYTKVARFGSPRMRQPVCHPNDERFMSYIWTFVMKASPGMRVSAFKDRVASAIKEMRNA